GQDRLPGRLLVQARQDGRSLFTQALRNPGVVGAAAALTDRRHGGIRSADTVPDDGVLCQRHQQDGWSNLLALQPPRLALSVPPLVELAQADDERLGKA